MVFPSFFCRRGEFSLKATMMTSNHDSFSESHKEEFDSDELLDRIEGDKNLFKEVIRIFVEDTPGLIVTLGEGISEKNADTVEKAAHAIKGSSAMISAKRLEGLADQLELMGRGNELNNAEILYRKVVTCFEDLKEIMISHLEKMKCSGH